MGVSDNAHIQDLRVVAQRILDLRGVDILASGDNHILLPVHDIEKAVRIQPAHITRMEPSAFEGRLRLLRTIPVAFHHVRSAHQDLPLDLGPHIPVIVVHHTHLRVEEGPAAGTDLGERVFAVEDRSRVAFRQAVKLPDLDPRLCVLLDQRHGNGGGIYEDQPYRTPVVSFEIGHELQKIQELGHGPEPVDFLFLDQLEKTLRVQGPEQDRPAAAVDNPRRTGQGPDVKQRQSNHGGFTHVHTQGGHQVHRVPEIVGVRKHRALGPARGSRRVENRQGIVVTPHLLRFPVRRLPDRGLVRPGPLRRISRNRNEVLRRDTAPDRIHHFGKLLAENQGLCPGVREDVLDFRAGKAVIDRDENRSDLSQPEVHVVVLRFIQREQAHTVARGHAQGLHRVRQPVRPLVDLPVRAAHILTDQPLPVRGYGRTLGQEASDIDPHHPALLQRPSHNGYRRRRTHSCCR